MNIGELAKGVAATTGTSETAAKAAITAVFEQIAEAAAVNRCPKGTSFVERCDGYGSRAVRAGAA